MFLLQLLHSFMVLWLDASFATYYISVHSCYAVVFVAICKHWLVFDLMNREGVETLAKTRALRLTEFTNLHEAIPTDVILE